MADSNGFFQIFDNYPDIDLSSTTSIRDIQVKFNAPPMDARELIEEALEKGLIEPVKSDNPLGVVSYMQRYRITHKGFETYLRCEE